uniref:Acetyl-coenzyme A synthetase n=1 Tax=Panagrellus redivivus TaxID=6233 RepID=A0A7E4VXI0_PANRE
MLRCLRVAPLSLRANLHSSVHPWSAAAQRAVAPPEDFNDRAFKEYFPGPCNYRQQYNESVHNGDEFWTNVANELHFRRRSGKGLEYNFDHRKGEVFVKFMDGSITNVAYNCLEKNIISGMGNKVAYKWEGNVKGDACEITYSELRDKVVEFARVLKSRGVKKGDVVALYLPMIIDLPVAMLACARIGAIHSVVFAGFSSNALAERVKQAGAKVLVTCDGFYRAEKYIPMKQIADDAVKVCEDAKHPVESVLCLEHLKTVTRPSHTTDKALIRDEENFEFAVNDAKDVFAPVEWVQAEDPLFILYTSGSTGAPKGVVHTTAGYMTTAYYSQKVTFDAQANNDVYWCMADCGWITGHTYGVYGPLLNGMTSVLFEGVPSYPDYSRTWEIVGKHKVSKLYTSPTAVRSMMAHPEEMVTNYDRSQLNIIGTVGEPMNPCAWKWLHEVVGERSCAIVDTYWQTETGTHLLTAHHSAVPQESSCGNLPFHGIVPALLDENGKKVKGPGSGTLVIEKAWPGMMRTLWGDYERFVNTYFAPFPGYYFTGDGAKRDAENHYWVTGRVDDLMNVSGHLLSTAEIESALAANPNIVEAAVVATPHDVKGQVPYAFITMPEGQVMTPEIEKEMRATVRQRIGAIAVPDVIQFTPGLPKTRSGKIVRRILRKVAEGERNADLGDITTLADDTVIAELWSHRPENAPVVKPSQ